MSFINGVFSLLNVYFHSNASTNPFVHASFNFEIGKLIKNNQIIFQYSTKDGKIEDSFPTNPNGAMHNIAAISNKKGNVMAIMPHPERASFIRQLPDTTELKNKFAGNFVAMEDPAPAMHIFKSMKSYIEERVL